MVDIGPVFQQQPAFVIELACLNSCCDAVSRLSTAARSPAVHDQLCVHILPCVVHDEMPPHVAVIFRGGA